MSKIRKFGTFGGVFTPSILTILGVIMYLRLPKIVGEAGLFMTLGIIVLAHVISFATGLSVASIATDKKVEAGGTYYMISRSLGLPIGGTLGLALFVGLSFSVSLYLIGFSESFLSVTGFDVTKNTIRVAGSAMLLLVTIVTFISTSLAIKMQFIIMGAIVMSLVSIFLGKHEISPAIPLLDINPESRESFIGLFGIFFPAVTGFEAGVSMSGDLKDPKKSIPKGSIAAIVVGFVVYIGLTFFFAYTVNRDALINDSTVLSTISLFAPLVIAGIWGATISSALGSILGAPRILQATALDRITPRIFGKGYGASKEPRNALLLTFIIAEAGILVGELDVIARVVSIFFITTYGFLNLSCAFESWASADFRPQFKIPIWISIVGAIACFIVMIELDLIAMIAATLVLGLVYLVLKKKELQLAGGDAWSGVWASIVKAGLIRLNQSQVHSRNWRPNIIMFHGETRHHLVELGKAIAGRLGILSGFQLIESNVPLLAKPQSNTSKIKTDTENYFEHQHYCRDFFSGIDEIARVYGFAGVEPNTILMGWSRNEAHKAKFLQLVKSLNKNDFNTIYLNYNHHKGYGDYKTIDIWWEGWGRNLSFAISLNKHMFYNSKWKQAEVRLLTIVPNHFVAEQVHKFLNKLMITQRVRFKPVIIDQEKEKLSREDIIIKESALSDLTILELKEKFSQTIEQVDHQMNALLPNLGTSLIIDASEDFEHIDLNITNPEKIIEKTSSEVVLTQLTLPQYTIAIQALKPLDMEGLKIYDKFYQKTISPFYVENTALLKDFISIIKITLSGLQKALSYQDNYRKTKALARVKNEYHFQVQKLFETLKDSKILRYQETFNQGLEEYRITLSELVDKVPGSLTIYYPKAEFNLKKNESMPIKWYKIRKKLSQLFSEHSISVNVDFRKGVEFYLENIGHRTLSGVLQDMNNSFRAILKDIKLAGDEMTKFLDQFNTSGYDFPDIASVEVYEKKLLTELQNIAQNQQNEGLGIKNHLRSEFRKNIQLLSYDLDKVAINILIAKKRIVGRNYIQVKEENISFADKFLDNTVLIINQYYLNALIQQVKERLFEEVTELLADLDVVIEKRIKKSITRVRQSLKNPEKSVTVDIQTEINISTLFNERFKELSKIITTLPETLTIGTEAEMDQQVETIEIPVRRMMSYYLESAFLGPIQDKLEIVTQELRRILIVATDSLRLGRFHYENVNQDDQNQLNNTIESLIRQVELDEKHAETIKQKLFTDIRTTFRDAFKPYATITTTLETSQEFSHSVKKYQGRKALSRIETYKGKLSNSVRNQLATLIYSRSEGMLFAKTITETQNVSAISRILKLVETVSPQQAVMEQLPNYYKNLFSGRSSIGQDFWIYHEEQEIQFEIAVNRFYSGSGGGIVMMGERNAGKTAFCKYAAGKYISNKEVYHIYPPRYGSTEIKDLEAEFKKNGIISGSIDDYTGYRIQTTIILHDLELWWERSPEGGNVIKLLKELIYQLQDRKVLFIINLNPYAFSLINKIYNLGDVITEYITLSPFDAEELKNMIMLRHFSSRMHFVWKGVTDKEISEWQLARLFNSIFNYSSGNPGDALNVWISSISRITNQTLYLELPKPPDLAPLQQLEADWMVMLAQMILHKRLSMEKLVRIFSTSEEDVQYKMNILKRSGLVTERNPGLYVVNPYIEPFITEELKERELI